MYPKLLGGLLLGGLIWGQTQVDLRTQSKNVDFSSAAETRPVKTGTILPATCAIGDVYFKSDVTAGLNLYGCTANNTWMQQIGTVALENNGVNVGNRSIENFVPGLGIINTMADTGAQINVQPSVDTGIIQTVSNAQAGTPLYCASASASATSYTCALNPSLTSYSTGMTLLWKPDVSGAGGITTLNVDTLGARNLTEADGVTTPVAGEITAGRLYQVSYDGTNFRLPPSSLVTAQITRTPAQCNGGVGATADWSTPSTGAASYACGGTAANNPTLLYPYGSAAEAYTRIVLPQNWVGNIDFGLQSSDAVAGSVQMEVGSECFGNGGPPSSTDYVFGNLTEQTVTISDANRHFVSFPNLTLPSTCTAGAELVLRLKRIAGILNESTGGLQVYSSVFTVRHN